jgi:hypothetical protein
VGSTHPEVSGFQGQAFKAIFRSDFSKPILAAIRFTILDSAPEDARSQSTPF